MDDMNDDELHHDDLARLIDFDAEAVTIDPAIALLRMTPDEVRRLVDVLICAAEGVAEAEV